MVAFTIWSTEKTLELVELLHSPPALRNVNCVDYENKMKKVDTQKKIAYTLSVSGSEVEKKIKALKGRIRSH